MIPSVTDRVLFFFLSGMLCCRRNTFCQNPLQKLVCHYTACRKDYKADAHTFCNKVTAHLPNPFREYLCNRSRIDGSCTLYISVRSTVKINLDLIQKTTTNAIRTQIIILNRAQQTTHRTHCTRPSFQSSQYGNSLFVRPLPPLYP